MAPQQKNNLWHAIQTAGIGVCITILTWVATKIQSFDKFQTKTETRLDTDESNIAGLRSSATDQNNRTENHEKRIYYVEGILFSSRKRTTNEDLRNSPE